MSPRGARQRDNQVHRAVVPEGLEKRHAKTRRWSMWLIGVGALALVAAACGSSSDASPGSSSNSTKVETLTLAIPAALVNFGDAYIASEEGYFQKVGLKVNVVDPGTTGTVALLQSGHADLAETATGLVIPAVKQGLGVTVITANGSSGGDYMVGGPKVTDMSQLKGLSKCVIGTQPIGSAAYAWALEFKDKLDLTNCSISQLATVPVLVSSALSGQVSVAVVVQGNVASLKAGGGHVLVDPTSPGFNKEFDVSPAPGAVTYGLTSHLKSIRPEIVKYLKAVQMAHQAMATFSVPVNTLASDFQKEQGFTAMSASDLVSQLNFAKSAFATTFGGPIGYIDETSWNAELQQLKNYGIAGYDPSASIYSYAKMVDMSYLNAKSP